MPTVLPSRSASITALPLPIEANPPQASPRGLVAVRDEARWDALRDVVSQRLDALVLVVDPVVGFGVLGLRGHGVRIRAGAGL